ncbi:hypothetical protein HMPREF3156_00931 [Neisseria sp. HMSC06F02]|nr:hypothetical protein HMPREF3156_00931 [Neisseria sp. HMSC06F02]
MQSRLTRGFVCFFEIVFFGNILISLIWTVIFLRKDDERRKNTF